MHRCGWSCLVGIARSRPHAWWKSREPRRTVAQSCGCCRMPSSPRSPASTTLASCLSRVTARSPNLRCSRASPWIPRCRVPMTCSSRWLMPFSCASIMNISPATSISRTTCSTSSWSAGGRGRILRYPLPRSADGRTDLGTGYYFPTPVGSDLSRFGAGGRRSRQRQQGLRGTLQQSFRRGPQFAAHCTVGAEVEQGAHAFGFKIQNSVEGVVIRDGRDVEVHVVSRCNGVRGKNRPSGTAVQRGLHPAFEDGRYSDSRGGRRGAVLLIGHDVEIGSA